MRKPYASTVRAVLFAVSLAVLITASGYVSTTIGTSQRHTATVLRSSVIALPRISGTQTHSRVRSKRVTPMLSYTVRPGDTLSIVSKRVYGDANTWPALWWINKHSLSNPNNLKVGQRLKLSNWHPVLGWLLKAAQNAIPAVAFTASTVRSSNVSYSSAASGPWPGGAFGACVVMRESGGNAQVMNSSGHYGLYQFSAGTWAAYGGDPALFGHASVAYQERIFLNALAQGGQNNWAPYDGC